VCVCMCVCVCVCVCMCVFDRERQIDKSGNAKVVGCLLGVFPLKIVRINDCIVSFRDLPIP